MKKLLGLLTFLVLVPGLAFAGWVQQQNGDGTADWVSTTNSYAVPLAGGPLRVTMPLISVANTAVIVSPVTGYITRILTVQNGATTGTQNVISLFYGGVGAQRAFQSTPVTFAVPVGATNTVHEVSITAGEMPVYGGAAIAIVSDGGSTGGNETTEFVIVIDPQ